MPLKSHLTAPNTSTTTYGQTSSPLLRWRGQSKPFYYHNCFGDRASKCKGPSSPLWAVSHPPLQWYSIFSHATQFPNHSLFFIIDNISKGRFLIVTGAAVFFQRGMIIIGCSQQGHTPSKHRVKFFSQLLAAYTPHLFSVSRPCLVTIFVFVILNLASCAQIFYHVAN